MPAPISSQVNVQISRLTAAVTRAGFGTPLIMGTNAIFADNVREYFDIDGVAEDFAAATDEYKAANAIFSQTPRPEKVKIGKRAAPVAQVQVITFSADFVADNNIDLDIDDVAVAQTPFNADHATTIANLATNIQAHASVLTAVANAVARTVTVTAQTAGVPFVISNVAVTGGASQATAIVATTVQNVGVAEDLTTISNEDDDWYGLVLTDRTAAVVAYTASLIESRRKIFITASSDTNIYSAASTTDIAAVINARNYERTAVLFNETPSSFPDAAWLGRCLPEDPGSITWKFKTLSSIAASNLTATQRQAILDKNANVVTTIGGVDITENGTMGVGEFIDVIRGVDWIQARLEENIFSRLKNSNKVPYTDAGVEIIANEIRAVLNKAIGQGILTPDPAPTVTVPLVADVAQVDKANRFLPDVKFAGVLAGAIHKVTVQGVVTV